MEPKSLDAATGVNKAAMASPAGATCHQSTKSFPSIQTCTHQILVANARSRTRGIHEHQRAALRIDDIFTNTDNMSHMGEALTDGEENGYLQPAHTRIATVSVWTEVRPGASQVFGETGTARIIAREDCVW